MGNGISIACMYISVTFQTKADIMKNNADLQKDVQDAIKWEPLLNAAEIGVTVEDGIVTLNGIVDSFAKKLEAETAAKNVAGVKAVVEKIEIRFDSDLKNMDDNDIAKAILNAWQWHWEIPHDRLKVKVEKGWVTLEGELEENYQREAAKDTIINLLGVKGVSNNIVIKSKTHDQIEKQQIEKAMRRNWSINDKNIDIQVSGQKVTLTGTVNSVYQKDQAARIAWNARGVITVDNELVVDNK
jgi:osmotically-inducible protein OsmY